MSKELGPPHHAPNKVSGTYEDGIACLLRQMAEALDFLHGRGVCHRDIKPSNVLLGPSGQVLLLDFNLSANSELSRKHLGGTLPYMAPEQLRAMNDSRQPLPGPAADIFALGVIVHELLTGLHPFGPVPVAAPSKDLADLLKVRHQQGPNSLRAVNRRVSRPLEALLARCLALDPIARPTAKEVIEEVEKHFKLARRWSRQVARHPVVSAGIFIALAMLSMGAVEYTRMLLAPVPLQSSSQTEASKLYERGRDCLIRNENANAFIAFQDSHNKSPNSQSLACMAYLEGKVKKHLQAIDLADRAIENGQQKNARVFNNRGYSQMMIYNRALGARDMKQAAHAFESASADFKTAMELDSTFQAPRYNRAILALRLALNPPSNCRTRRLKTCARRSPLAL